MISIFMSFYETRSQTVLDISRAADVFRLCLLGKSLTHRFDSPIDVWTMLQDRRPNTSYCIWISNPHK